MTKIEKWMVLFVTGLATAALPAAVVAPGAFQNAEGNVGFNSLAPNGVGEQYLELVLGSNFSGAVQITGFDLRLRDSNDCPGCSPFSTTLSNLTVDLATTPLANTNDGTYAHYLTTNLQTVISGSLAVSSADSGPPTGPTAFDIHFGFASPYSYNPASGNLVVYIGLADNTGTIGIPANEAMDGVLGSSVFRIFGGFFQGGIGSCNCVQQTTGIGDNFGYVMRLDTAAAVTGTPEPFTLWLIAPAIAWMALRRTKAHAWFRRRSPCMPA